MTTRSLSGPDIPGVQRRDDHASAIRVLPRASEVDSKAANKIGYFEELVMPGLVPGIHVFAAPKSKDVDGRDIGERKRRRPLDGYARP
jgi:hypothetical protein